MMHERRVMQEAFCYGLSLTGCRPPQAAPRLFVKRAALAIARGNAGTFPCSRSAAYASNMMTDRRTFPAFMLAKPSLISDSSMRAEIQSSRCSRPLR